MERDLGEGRLVVGRGASLAAPDADVIVGKEIGQRASEELLHGNPEKDRRRFVRVEDPAVFLAGQEERLGRAREEDAVTLLEVARRELRALAVRDVHQDSLDELRPAGVAE